MKNPYKKLKQFYKKRMVVQLRQKDTCTLLDITMSEYRGAYNKLVMRGEIFVEKINGGYANRVHWIFG